MSEPTPGTVIAVVGASGAVIGSVAPWVSVSFGSIHATAAGTSTDDGKAILGLALVAVVVGLLAYDWARWLSAGAALAVAGLAIHDLVDFSHAHTGPYVSMGWGLIVTVLASVALVIGTLLRIRELPERGVEEIPDLPQS